jgi:addiction module RelE/StbE family toxin
MEVLYEKRFIKQYQKLPRAVQDRTEDRIALFMTNPVDPALSNHPLKGEYKDCRSINITGDYRAVYRDLGADIALFVAIGTHSELYG